MGRCPLPPGNKGIYSCLHAVDYKECADCTLKRLKDKGGREYEKEVVVTGTDYDINDMKLSRRKLLTQRHGGC